MWKKAIRFNPVIKNYRWHDLHGYRDTGNAKPCGIGVIINGFVHIPLKCKIFMVSLEYVFIKRPMLT